MRSSCRRSARISDGRAHGPKGGRRRGADALLLEEVDELDLAELAKVALELLLGEGVEVLDVAHVDVARRTRVHSKCECGRQRPRVLAPADLQPAVVERQALVRRDLEEGEGSGRVDEGHELDSR